MQPVIFKNFFRWKFQIYLKTVSQFVQFFRIFSQILPTVVLQTSNVVQVVFRNGFISHFASFFLWDFKGQRKFHTLHYSKYLQHFIPKQTLALTFLKYRIILGYNIYYSNVYSMQSFLRAEYTWIYFAKITPSWFMPLFWTFVQSRPAYSVAL